MTLPLVTRLEGVDAPVPDATAAAESAEREGGRRRRRRGGRGRGERDEARGEGIEGGELPADEAVLDTAPAGDAEGTTPDAEPTEGERDGDDASRRRRRGGRGRRERAETGEALAVEAVEVAAPAAAVAATDAAARPWWDAEPASAAEPAAGTGLAQPAVEESPAQPVAEAPAVVMTSPLSSSAPAEAPAQAPVVEAYALPLDTLSSLAREVGLEWVHSDTGKVREAQEAIANAPKPIRVPREPKPVVAVDDGPLVLVETRKDLSQIKLPFEQQA